MVDRGVVIIAGRIGFNGAGGVGFAVAAFAEGTFNVLLDDAGPSGFVVVDDGTCPFSIVIVGGGDLPLNYQRETHQIEECEREMF